MVPVAALVDDSLGLQAYMRIDALHRCCTKATTITGAAVTRRPGAHCERFYAAVKAMPAVAGVALTAVTLQNFRETMAENMNLQIFINVMFAGVIAFGVVYNSARVSLSERSASWRACACWASRAARSRSSCSASWPCSPLAGAAGRRGHRLRARRSSSCWRFNNEMYRLSFVVAAGDDRVGVSDRHRAPRFISGLVVRRRLDRLDLVGVLKTRE